MSSVLGRRRHGHHLGNAHWALWLGFGDLFIPPVRLGLCGLLLQFLVSGVRKSERDSFVSLVRKGSGTVFLGGAWVEAAVSPGTQEGEMLCDKNTSKVCHFSSFILRKSKLTAVFLICKFLGPKASLNSVSQLL